MNEDDKMTDEALSSLKSLRAAEPSPEAKKLALNAALVAFDAAQASRKKAASAGGWLSRWKLGAGLGVPAATAVAALVLLPIGSQMIATNNPIDGTPPAGKDDVAITTMETPVEQPVHEEFASNSATTQQRVVEPAKPVAPATVDQEAKMADEASRDVKTAAAKRVKELRKANKSSTEIQAAMRVERDCRTSCR